MATKLENELKCPKCGGMEFQKGPRGGLSINLKCRCGQKINAAFTPDGRWWIEEI